MNSFHVLDCEMRISHTHTHKSSWTSYSFLQALGPNSQYFFKTLYTNSLCGLNSGSFSFDLAQNTFSDHIFQITFLTQAKPPPKLYVLHVKTVKLKFKHKTKLNNRNLLHFYSNIKIYSKLIKMKNNCM